MALFHRQAAVHSGKQNLIEMAVQGNDPASHRRSQTEIFVELMLHQRADRVFLDRFALHFKVHSVGDFLNDAFRSLLSMIGIDARSDKLRQIRPLIFGQCPSNGSSGRFFLQRDNRRISVSSPLTSSLKFADFAQAADLRIVQQLVPLLLSRSRRRSFSPIGGGGRRNSIENIHDRLAGHERFDARQSEHVGDLMRIGDRRDAEGQCLPKIRSEWSSSFQHACGCRSSRESSSAPGRRFP